MIYVHVHSKDGKGGQVRAFPFESRRLALRFISTLRHTHIRRIGNVYSVVPKGD